MVKPRVSALKKLACPLKSNPSSSMDLKTNEDGTKADDVMARPLPVEA